MAERLRDKFKKVIGLEDDDIGYDEQDDYGEYSDYGGYEERTNDYRREPESPRGDYSRMRNSASGTARTQSYTDYRQPHVDASNKVVDIKEVSDASAKKKADPVKLVVTEPKSIHDCPKLVDNLRTKKPVIINLEGVTESAVKHQIFDFLSGATYAIDGRVQKITDGIFVFTPTNIEVITIEKDENGKPKNVSMKDMSWSK